MSPNPTTLAVVRTPIVDPKTGMATWTFLKKIQEYETKLSNAITLLGEIASAAIIEGRTEGIGTTVGNVDSGGVVLAAGVDFARAYVGKNLDNVPNATRAAWDTVGQKTSSVDSSGNLLFKNVLEPTPTTSSPSTTSTTFATLPEMTQAITTNGLPVLLSFTGTFIVSFAAAAAVEGQFQLFRGVTALGGIHKVTWFSAAGAGFLSAALLLIDTPSAATYTYTLEWRLVPGQAGGPTLTSNLLARKLQVVEYA